MRYLLIVLILAGSAFASESAAELAQMCDSLDAKGSEVYSVDRNSNLGFCLGYMNAVMDSLQDRADLVVVKDFIVGDMIKSFRPYEKLHYAQPAKDAIIDSLIEDGFIKRK